MKKASLLLASLCAGLAFSTGAMAQQFKVGVVNVDRLLAESNQAKSARAQLESQFKARDAALAQSSASIRQRSEQYEKDFPKLSDAQRAERENDLKQSIAKFEAERAKFEEEYSAAQNQTMQAFLGRADALIKKISETEGYDLVVTEAAYVKAQYDLTQKLIDGLK